MMWQLPVCLVWKRRNCDHTWTSLSQHLSHALTKPAPKKCSFVPKLTKLNIVKFASLNTWRDFSLDINAISITVLLILFVYNNGRKKYIFIPKYVVISYTSCLPLQLVIFCDLSRFSCVEINFHFAFFPWLAYFIQILGGYNE